MQLTYPPPQSLPAWSRTQDGQDQGQNCRPWPDPINSVSHNRHQMSATSHSRGECLWSRRSPHRRTSWKTDNTIRPPPLQPFYNSGTTGPIETKMTPVDSAYAISTTVSKLVTSGDLIDLQRSPLGFRLLQPFYNWNYTGRLGQSRRHFRLDWPISSWVIEWLQ